jgi:predicted ATP-grasp superfamily ATP-dependent carboligase
MKVLLLDTNLAALPIYNYLISLGYNVFVVGLNKNDTLAISCDNYVNLDYSDIELMVKFVKENDFDFTLPGCNDISYKTASILNEKISNKLNISPSDINELINNKDKFKKFAYSNNIKVPKEYSKNQIGSIGGSKIIVKPVDSYSGKGVSVLSDFTTSQLVHAIEFAESNSISKNCIIEEFVSGQLFSHSAFIKDGEYFQDFIVKEYCSINPYSVDTSWVIDNNEFNLYDDIRNEVKKIFTTLNLCDGLIHTQFIVEGNNFWILEVTRRCPGDLYSRLIEYSTDFNYSKYYVDFILKTIPFFQDNLLTRRILRKTLTFKDETIWYSFKSKNDKLRVLEFYPLAISGKKLQIAPKDKAGIVFYISDSQFAIDDL